SEISNLKSQISDLKFQISNVSASPYADEFEVEAFPRHVDGLELERLGDLRAKATADKVVAHRRDADGLVVNAGCHAGQRGDQIVTVLSHPRGELLHAFASFSGSLLGA